MSLAQITEKIEKDAKSEAKRILDKAREQEAQIKSETDAEVKKIEESSRVRFEKERPEIFKRREIVARLDVNKLHLDAQRKLIKDVFDGVLAKLRSLDKDKYVSFCSAMLKNAIDTGNETLMLGKDEKHLNKSWLDRFNSEHNTSVTLSPHAGDFSGGFVLENGRIDINCSLEMIVQSAQENLETKVVKRLFQM